jgi:hypothetical protein
MHARVTTTECAKNPIKSKKNKNFEYEKNNDRIFIALLFCKELFSSGRPCE